MLRLCGSSAFFFPRYNVSVLTVRKYQPHDFERLLEIDQSCFVEGIAYSEPEMRYFLSMPTLVPFVGLRDEEILGFTVARRLRLRGARPSLTTIITDDAPAADQRIR